MADCIFCNIAKGDVPAPKVYEDDFFLAFLDVKPRNKGHVLVIPKEHFRWVWEYPHPGLYFELAAKLAKAQRIAFGTDYIVSCIFGEEIPHAHIHLIPRFPNDGHGASISMSVTKTLSDFEQHDALQKLKSALATLL